MLLLVLLAVAQSVQAGLLGTQMSDNVGLEKRATCYEDRFGVPYSCNAGYRCCVTNSRAYAACIPAAAVCCDFGSSAGWCLPGQRCGTTYGIPVCINSRGTTVAAPSSTEIRTETETAIKTMTHSDEPSSTSESTTSESTYSTLTSSHSPSPANSITPQLTTTPGSGGLSQAAIIGIAVSVSCSVLGLIVGVWVKWHWSRKSARKGEVG